MYCWFSNKTPSRLAVVALGYVFPWNNGFQWGWYYHSSRCIWDTRFIIIASANVLLLNGVAPPHETSSNGNVFRVTGHLCGEFTGHRWIPHTQASDTELWCFLWSVREKNGWVKQSRGWWFETPSRPLWRHCNDARTLHTSRHPVKKACCNHTTNRLNN